MKQFSISFDKNGDMVMAAGWLVAARANVRIRVAGRAVVPASLNLEEGVFGASWASRPSLAFVGGSGRNIVIPNPPGTAAPVGHFRPTVAGRWESLLQNGVTLTYDAGTGDAVISDATNDIATGSGFTTAPVGAFTLTAYGEDEYNGGDPGTLETDWEGGGPIPGARIEVSGGTLTIQDFSATAVDAYVGDDDSDFEIEIAGDGSATIRDASDIIAERATGGSLFDPTGIYQATSYGETTFNSGEAFTVMVTRQVANPVEGYVYLKVTESAPGVPSTVEGPFFAPTKPDDSDPIFYVPVCWSDGAGGIEPFVEGPIQWGGGGGSVPIVQIGLADFIALDPPDSATLYAVTGP